MTGIASHPFWLHWTGDAGGRVSHAPDYFARRADGSAVVVDCRQGGRVILHHGHIRPVLIRDWSPEMDGITATIWASQTTLHDCARVSSERPPSCRESMVVLRHC